MICLNKLQNVLSDILELDRSTLPDVKEILKSQGYTGIQKGKEFIELVALQDKTGQSAKVEKDITFTDNKGKTHTITKETQEQWLKTFNLKSIDEDFIPTFAPEVRDVLDKAGIGEIHLKAGSLVKLERENRLRYLDRIKPTLEQPDRIVMQDEKTIIFAKDFNEEKYFTSVAKDENGEWVVTSNAPKSENGLNNKIEKGGREIYNKSQATPQINARDTYDDIAQSNIKLDDEIILQSKQKTINAVDNYANTDEFKALSKEKQEAILSLKNIEPSPMPEGINIKDFENLRVHFNDKLDKAQREEYLKLFDLTKQEPDFILKVQRNGEPREEYIKAFQHKENKDMYYLAITKDNTEITGIPTTQIKKVIKEIRDCENIESARALEKIAYPAAPLDSLDSQRSKSILPQESKLPPLQKALNEKQAMLDKIEAELAQKEAAFSQRVQEQKTLREQIIKQKEALAGLKENDRILHIGEPISLQKVPNLKSSVSLDDESIYNLDFAIVKAKDLKPNFESTGVQTRTQANEKVIEKIANDFKPQMIFNRGGFDDVPIILSDGQVLSGNHRAKGMQSFTPQSRDTYNKAIKEAYNVDLKDDELLVRIPQGDLSTKELINLASASNLERVSNIGDKVIAALGKYDKHIADLGRIESESVEELISQVAKSLDKNAAHPELESPNLALLAHNARNSDDLSLSALFNRLSKALDLEDFNTLKDMYVKNAGSFHNILKDSDLRDLSLQDYLLEAIKASGNGLKKSRAENFNALNDKIEYVLKSTDEKGSNAFIKENPRYYEDIIAEALGYGFARFARLENPEGNLYEFMKGSKEVLRDQVAPSLLNPEGKSLKEADVFDFIELLIHSGEGSEATAKVVNNLPALREKYKAFNSQSPSPNVIASEQGESKLSTSQATPTPHESTQELQAIAFTDNKGKTHTITKETQEQWLKTFNLQDINQTYIPKQAQEVKEALGNKEIKLQIGSLKKLVSQGREQYIKEIKEVLENPQAIIKDEAGDFLLIKHLKDDDYFVNVSFDNGEYLVSISNGIKETNNLKNKLEKGAEILYQSPNANSILQTLLQASRYSTNEIDNPIIPQPSPKWSKKDQKQWKAQKEAERESIKQNLQAPLSELDEAHRALLDKRAEILAKPNLTEKEKQEAIELNNQIVRHYQNFAEQYNKDLDNGYEIRITPPTEIGGKSILNIEPSADKFVDLHSKGTSRAEQGIKANTAHQKFYISKMEEIEAKFANANYMQQIQKLENSPYALSELHKLKATIKKDLDKYNKYYNLSNTKSPLTHYTGELDIIEQKIADIKARRKQPKEPTQEPSAEIKIHQNLKQDKIQHLEPISQKEYDNFVDMILSKDYANAPAYVRLENLNDNLLRALGLQKGEIYLSKNDLSHFSPNRKEAYNQALRIDEIKAIPQVITEAKEAYIDTKKQNFFLTFKDKENENKINILHFNADEQGNYIVTAKKVDIHEVNKQEYKKVSVAEGLAPTIPQEVKEPRAPSTTLTASTTDNAIIPQLAKKQYDLSNKEDLQAIRSFWHSASDDKDNQSIKALFDKALDNGKDNIVESRELEKAFLDINNNQVNLESLHKYAIPLPQAKNKTEFLAQIPQKDDKGFSTISTPIGDIKINLSHAWNHLNRGNTYKKDRSMYSGAFLDTLTDPLFIVKQEYTANPKLSANAKAMQNSKLVQKSDKDSIAQDSYAFFKPYSIKGKFNYMVGYALDIEGNIINTTFIPMSQKDLNRIKKMFASETLYFKKQLLKGV